MHEADETRAEHILRSLDYTHSWTFDVEHVVELYQVCRMHPGEAALEIGSFRGHCALAMALAGLQVTSLDTSEKHLNERTRLIESHGVNVDFRIESSDDHLEQPGRYDVILHDNTRRGSALIAELRAYWERKLNSGGLLIVHNVEQIKLERFLRRLEPDTHIVTTDKRRRQLGYFAKP